MKISHPTLTQRLWLCSLVACFIHPAHSLANNRTIDLRRGQSFENAVESLEPGDTLIVHAGTYSGVGRISINVQGNAEQPVVIHAAAGEARPLITRPSGQKIQNTINIEGASYLTIQGLEISSNGGDAIRVNEAPSHHIVLQDLLIHDVDVGINTKNNSHDFIIRNNHIYDTGDRNGTGEGLYIGCHNGSCSLKDALIENNLIHDTLPGTSQGDGIEVKLNSENIQIRHNVVYNRSFPGIFVYGGQNITVEGNVVWNSLEGIAAISDTVVRNNILFDNQIGLNSFHHPVVPKLKQTRLINNTLYNNKIGASLRWKDASGMVLANNAIYSPGQTAVDARTAQQPIQANITTGKIIEDSDAPQNHGRFIPGRSAKMDFTNPANREFWPKISSPLIAGADPDLQPKDDFNNTLRFLSSEVGAYALEGHASNPGWPISETFKASLLTSDNPNATTTAAVFPQSGLWWNPESPGHGVDIHVLDDILFVVWYTYNSAGSPVWFIGRGPFNGDYWQTDLELYAWDHANQKADFNRIGSLTLSFDDQSHAEFSWTLNGVNGHERIEYFVASTKTTTATDYSGTWLEPARPGYGLTTAFQGDTEFSVLYFYDRNGAPVWAAGSTSTQEPSYPLYTYKGACPGCVETPLTRNNVGTITTGFDCDAEGSLSVDLALTAPLSGDWVADNVQIRNLGLEKKRCNANP